MEAPSVSKAWQAVVAPFKWFVRVLLVAPIAWVYNKLGAAMKKILGKEKQNG